MSIREILRLGHPALRLRAQPVPESAWRSPWLGQLIEDLRDTMRAANGLGIAAPQIGESWRVALVEVPGENPRYPDAPAIPFGVYINPELDIIDPTPEGYWEGCLSVPGLRGYVERPRHVRVRYQDANGAHHEIDAPGFAATVFQHEFDHLDGLLYVDRLANTKALAFLDEYEQFHAPTSAMAK